jgi:hypothetical protein
MIISADKDKILLKLALLKKELGSVKKSADNPFFSSKYADLNAHLDIVEPLLEKNKMILLQPASAAAEYTIVESIIFDVESSQFVSSAIRLVLSKQDMQQMGSAVTYARRYTLASLLAMQAEDDDGNAASDLGRKSVVKPKKKSNPVDEF